MPLHCLTDCFIGRADCSALFDHIASTNTKFAELCNIEKFNPLECPINASDFKLVREYFDNHFKGIYFILVVTIWLQEEITEEQLDYNMW